MLRIDPAPNERGVEPPPSSHQPFLMDIAVWPQFILGSWRHTGAGLWAASPAVLWWILSVIMIWRKILFMGYINNLNWLRHPKCAFFAWLPRLLSLLLIMFHFSFQQKQEIKHPLLEWQLFNRPTFQHPLCNFRPRASQELSAFRTVYPLLQGPHQPPVLLNNRAQCSWGWNTGCLPLLPNAQRTSFQNKISRIIAS